MKKATRQHTKQHNKRLILKTIYNANGISRADIARDTELTRATVSTIVSHLMDDGLVDETGVGQSAGGKPPIFLGVQKDARQLLCIDLSNDPFQGALINLRGELVERVTVDVNGRSAKAALDLVLQLVDQLKDTSDSPILGIGIGTPGLVNTKQGIVQIAVNLDWEAVPLKQILEEKYDLPVFVANDSHLAALAEYSFGGHDTNNLVLIKTGHAVGSGIVLNGQLYFGEGFGAGEIGHVTVVDDGPLCTCGNRGCLEEVVRVSGILQQAADTEDGAWTIIKPANWTEFCNAINNHEAAAQKIVNKTGCYLGNAVANLVGILNMRHIVIAGELAALGDGLVTAVSNQMKQRVLPTMAAQTTVHTTKLGADLVLLGASAMILNERLGVI